MIGRGRSGLAARRLIAGSVVGIVVAAGTAAFGAKWQVAVSLGWCALALVILVWVWATIGRKDAEATAEHARSEDFSRATADLVLLGASVSSLVAVAVTLVLAGHAHDGRKVALVTLTILTVTLAWLLVHTVFTVRYGDLYYADPVGGIDFNEDDKPDYRDFAYLALTIGMTFQVSDTDLQAKPIRRIAIRHALLSYAFGTIIVAITINIVAGLLSK
ncbi:MAG TPA: DUF1345 domain-containing protein [Gaiellaceae bacterium]|nr:DUF1345 domain-containing protein [Gaiellaceae bacterium]